MRNSVKLSEIKAGNMVTVDDGFTCMSAGTKTVERDSHGLYVSCEKGKHYLDGQLNDDGYCIGVTLP